MVLVGKGAGRRPRRDAELGEDVLEVPGDGVLADEQIGGDVPVSPAANQVARSSRSAGPSVSPLIGFYDRLCVGPGAPGAGPAALFKCLALVHRHAA